MTEYLNRWTRPDHYAGAEWPEWFVFLSQARDSDSLVRSNFECALKALGGESETVIVVRDGHWAVGWLEWIGIHESDASALDKAREIAERLEDYPVVDEMHWSELEYSEACDFWAQMSIRDRMALCREAGISVFSARRDYMPEDDSGFILESLRS